MAQRERPLSLPTWPTSRKQVRTTRTQSLQEHEQRVGKGWGPQTFVGPQLLFTRPRALPSEISLKPQSFTQFLADCTAVIGYNTQLFCCVRVSKVSRGGPVHSWAVLFSAC